MRRKYIEFIDDDPQGGCLVRCVCGSEFSDRGKVECPSCHGVIRYPRGWN